MPTYIFHNSRGQVIGKRSTVIETGLHSIVRFKKQTYRVQESRAKNKQLLCSPTHYGLMKLDPVQELTTFFSLSGIDWFKEKPMTEHLMACAFLKLARTYFTIELEVPGVHRESHPDGHERSLRIDAILTPKKEAHLAAFGYYNPQPFGVEFKAPTSIGKDSGHSLANVFAQCVDYTECSFGDHGRIPVFLFPLFDHRLHAEVLNFLAKLNVGVITADLDWGKPSYTFRFGEMAFWTSQEGFTKFSKNRSMQRKYGNRA